MQVQTVQLTVTEACNLDCVYCFAQNKSKRKMSSSLAREIAARHLDADSPFDAIEFDFAGGEPLVALDVMQDVVSFVHSRSWKKKHGFGFTTNGTLLNEKVKGWLSARDCIQFSISFDGTREAHNANRSGSYDRAVAHVPWLLERCHRLGMTSSTKMTISPQTVGLIAEGVIHLHRLGFEEVNANVPYEDLWSDADRNGLLLNFASQLDLLVDYYDKNPSARPPHLVRLPIHRLFSEPDDQLAPRWCGSGRTMVCYDTNGEAYPCHRFVPMAVGKDRPYDGKAQLQPKTRLELEAKSPCLDCPFVQACPSCLGFNWQVYGDPDVRTRFHCPFMLIQFKASAKLELLRLSAQIERARAGRENADVIGQLASRLDEAMVVMDLLA